MTCKIGKYNFIYHIFSNIGCQLILILFLMVGGELCAQDFDLYEWDLKYKNQNRTSSQIFQDNNGFLWYATPEGLIKDYGTTQHFIPMFESNKVIVFDIEQDPNGYIWLAFDDGAYKIHPETFQIELVQWRPKDSVQYEAFNSLLTDNLGNFWILTGFGNLLKYRPDGTLALIGTLNLDRQTYCSLHQNTNGVLIVRTIIMKDDKRQCNLYKFSQGKMIQVYQVADEIGKQLLQYNLLDTLPGIVSPQNEGTYQYKETTHVYNYIAEIDMYLVKDYHELFMLKETNEVVLHDGKEVVIGEFFDRGGKLELIPLQTFKEKQIGRNIFYDPIQECIIVGHVHKIVKIRKKKRQLSRPEFMSQLSHISTRDMVLTPENRLFLASYSGTFMIDRTHNVVTKLKLDHPMANLLYDMELDGHTLWATTANEPLAEIDINSLKKKYHLHVDATLRTIVIKPKDKQSYWVGTYQGLYVFDKVSGTFALFDELNKHVDLNHQIKDMLFDVEKNILWLVVPHIGVIKYVINKDEAVLFNENSGTHQILSNETRTIHKDKNDNIWLGTKKGINKITPQGAISAYTLKDGISDLHVVDVLETTNHLWFTTFNGVTCLEKETEKITNLFASGTVSDNEFNGCSALKVNDSLLYFGGTNGVYQFLVNDIYDSSIAQELIPISLESYDTELQEAQKTFNLKGLKQIVLTHDNNSFELEVGLTHSFNPNNNQYQYFIEGITPEWVPLEHSNTIKVFGMPPGTYTLEVSAKNARGEQAINKLRFPIHVSQVFYKTPLFIIMSLIGLLILTGVTVRSFYRKQQQTERVTNELKQLELKALATQMNPHFIFNVMNGIQHDVLTKDTDTTLEHIYSFSILIRVTMEMIASYEISLQREIDYLTAYINLQKRRLNGDLEFSIIYDEHISLAKVNIPCMLLQPIIENAIFHGLEPKTTDRNLKVLFAIQEETLHVSIEDNGIGRKASTSQGIIKENHALGIINKRIDMKNDRAHNSVQMEVIDLFKGDKPIGTRVNLDILIKKLN